MDKERLQTIITSIKNRDWHTANESFGQLMRDKVGDRLNQERQTAYSPQPLKEESISADEIQRVFDETKDARETETLCGVSNIKVNEKGQVISYESN